MDEPETVTIAGFRSGLRPDIRKEVYLGEVHYLAHAYQIARDIENLQWEPIFSEPTKVSNISPRQEPSQTNLGQLDLSPPMTCEKDKDDTLKIQQTLYIDEVEKEEPEPTTTGECKEV